MLRKTAAAANRAMPASNCGRWRRAGGALKAKAAEGAGASSRSAEMAGCKSESRRVRSRTSMASTKPEKVGGSSGAMVCNRLMGAEVIANTSCCMLPSNGRRPVADS
jgi:hypothetical protein